MVVVASRVAMLRLKGRKEGEGEGRRWKGRGGDNED